MMLTSPLRRFGSWSCVSLSVAAVCVALLASGSGAAPGQEGAVAVLAWAETLEPLPNPAVVADPGLRMSIERTGLPWRVTDKSTGIELLLVPPGTFQQGSVPGSSDAKPNESPQRQVTLTEPYYLGRTELSRAEWARLSALPQPSADEAQLAATGISHTEADVLLKRHGLRLPTEAEWEVASHACGTWSPEGVLEAFAWFRGNAEGRVHAVGTLLPNTLGLHDMLGNVEEWCADWYSATEYSGSTNRVSDPRGPATGIARVLKGGSWQARESSCRTAARGGEPADFKSSTVGLRVARSVRSAPEAALSPAPTQPPPSAPSGASPKIQDWAEIVEQPPDPKVVRDARLRGKIEQTGLPWRVKDKGTGIEMLLVPPGKYRRGASPGDHGARADEKPAHDVTITRPFYLGRYEVTQAEWRAAMGWNRSTKSNDPQAPVENVSDDDIEKFNKKTGLRLPTEAEWEYACRAGTTSASYGELNDVAWHYGNSGSTTHPVGRKRANALGFHDMLGNVREWCSDRYASDEYGRCAAGVVDPKGPSSGKLRVLRGGSWRRGLWAYRTSARIGRNSAYYDDSGFRAARSL